MVEDPNLYKKNINIPRNSDVEDIYKRLDCIVPDDMYDTLALFVKHLDRKQVNTDKQLQQELVVLQRKYKLVVKKSQLLHVYNTLLTTNDIKPDHILRRLLQKKAAKSESGVLVITVLTSPYPSFTDVETGKKQTQRFSCKWNCYYCPNEPGQPRSYLHDEPAVLRANQNHFDAELQFIERAATLAAIGHPVDKIELLILGGTWASYPQQYQEEFIRDLFYAANTFYERTNKRPRMTLKQEQEENESALCKVIGLTLETRPDCINENEIRLFRKYGCTRVQLGIQHTDDNVLKQVNRESTRNDAVKAIKLLKNACYKIDIHLMPNLPGSNLEMDEKMFTDVLYSEDLQVDQWKIYPCEVVPWTVIKKWHENGKYVPYHETDLFELLMKIKAQVHPWIRLNRVVRDIPSQYISGGIDSPNLRQTLLLTMKQRGTSCRCIRCREVGRNMHRHVDKHGNSTSKLMLREYKASNAREIFISIESPDEQTIMGFLRLRLCDPNMANQFPELNGAAFIRELHVYGQLIATSDRINRNSQHQGFGTQMMKHAEYIAVSDLLFIIYLLFFNIFLFSGKMGIKKSQLFQALVLVIITEKWAIF